MPIPFATYRLSRAALEQKQFLATELAALTGVPLNTVYSFIAELGTRLTSESLASGNVGRRQKLYTLTDEGIDYLLDRNLEFGRQVNERVMAPGRAAAEHQATLAESVRGVQGQLHGIAELHRRLLDHVAAATKRPASKARLEFQNRFQQIQEDLSRLEKRLDSEAKVERAAFKQVER